LLLFAVVGLGVGPLVRNVLQVVPDQRSTTETALVIAAGAAAVLMLSQVFQSALQGAHRFDIFVILTNATAIAINVGSVLLVLSGYNVVHIMLLNLLVVAAAGIGFVLYARREIPELKITSRIDRSYWSTTMRYAASMLVYQTVGNLLLLFERGWITREMGSAALTYYVIPMVLGTYFNGLVGNVVLVIFPVMNELVDDPVRFERVYRLATKLVVLAAAGFSVTMVVTGKSLLLLWVGPPFAERSYVLLVLLSFVFSLTAVGTVAWQVSEAYRKPSLNAWVMVAWAVVAAPLMVILSSRSGLDGVGAGRLVGALAFIPFVAYVNSLVARTGGRSLWAALLLRVLVIALAVGGVEWFVLRASDSEWLALLTALAAGLVTAALAVPISGLFDRDELTALWSAVKQGTGMGIA
jgi:O-antigen/teichoic acid export membrane protein